MRAPAVKRGQRSRALHRSQGAGRQQELPTATGYMPTEAVQQKAASAWQARRTRGRGEKVMWRLPAAQRLLCAPPVFPAPLAPLLQYSNLCVFPMAH